MQMEQSPESQLVEIQRYAAQNNILIQKEYIFMEQEGFTKEELLKPRYGALILEMDECPEGWTVVGETTEETVMVAAGETLCLYDVVNKYCEPLEGVFPVKTAGNEAFEGKTIEKINFAERNVAKPAILTAKPKVIIPTFPGTNCEMGKATGKEAWKG